MKAIKCLLLNTIFLNIFGLNICHSQLSPAESAQIDSLQDVIESASHDSIIINAWLAWKDIIYPTDSNLELKLNFQIDSLSTLNLKNKISLTEKDYFQKSKTLALSNIGFIYRNQGNYSEAINYFNQCLKMKEAIRDNAGIANSLNNIGNVYYYQGDYKESINYFTRSLKIREKTGDKVGLANTLNNIAGIYYAQHDLINAIHYLNQSLEIKKEIGDKKSIGSSLNNLGNIYKEQGDYNEAINCYFQSLEIRKEIGDKRGISTSLNSIGSIYQYQGNYADAKGYFFEALKIKEEIGDKSGITYVLNNIGDVFCDQGKYIVAQEYSQKSLQLAQELGLAIETQNSARSLWKINKELGIYKEALQMYELYITMRDSLQSEENQRAVIQQEYQYNYEKQHLSDSLAFAQQQELEQVAHDAALEKEAQQRYVLYGGLGFLLLLGGVTFRGYTRKKKDNQLISAQKKEVEAAHEKLESTHEQLEESHQEIKDSIHYAERIQRSFLAGKELLDQHLKDYYVFFQPKDVVSGDFYWASTLEDGHFALCCADSTGHGVPGAIMSLLNTTSLEKAIENETAPHLILDATRKIIIDRLKKDGSAEGGKDGMDCSLLVFNPDKTKLSFAAAHNPVFIVRNGELIEFKGDKMPVGKHDKQEDPFTLHQFDLQKGDVIYTLTDGFPDQFGGAKGKKYMIKNFKTKLLEIAQLPMSEQQQLLSSEFSQWKGDHEQVDDVCVIGIRV